MKQIGVIINPNAKKFRTGKVSIKTYINLSSTDIIVNTPKNLDELKQIAKHYKKINLDYICIGGGDGTIHVVLSELINAFGPQKLPPILILKEGTMNNIARSIKLNGKGPNLLKKLIKLLNKNTSIKTEIRHTMKIGDKYCFLFGTGIVTNFLNKAYSGKEKGLFRNIEVALIGIKEVLMNKRNGEIFTEANQDIFLNNKKVPINPITGILAGTVEHIGMGFSPMANSVHFDSVFQIIILGISPRKILLNINKLRKGKIIKSPDYLNTISSSIKIKQSGTFEYTMDGDIYSAVDELFISMGPAIRFVKI